MSKEHIIYILNSFYHKLILVELYREYFIFWIEKGLVTTTIKANLSRQDAQRISKDGLLDILYQVYTDKRVLGNVYPTFSPAVQKAFLDVAWYGAADIVKLEKEFSMTIADRGGRHSMPEEFHVLSTPFRFFRYSGSYYYSSYGWSESKSVFSGSLVLPEEIFRLLRAGLPKPDEYTISSVEKPATAFTIDEEQTILDQIELYFTYVNGGNVERSSKTGSPTVAAIKKMREYCQIDEWFEGKEYQYCKTFFLDAFLAPYDKNKSNPKILEASTPADYIRQILTNVFQDASLFWNIGKMLLPHVKNITTYGYEEKKLGLVVKEMLLALPRDGWIAIDAYISYLNLHDVKPELHTPWSMGDMYVLKPEGRYGYKEKIYLKDMAYATYFLTPFVKAILFVFASLGIVSLAYNEAKPRTDLDKQPLIPFDGLKAIKLTALGCYCLGKTEVFTPPAIQQSNAVVFLDEHTLTATYDGDNKIIKLAMERMGTLIGNNRYQVDFASLFKECKSLADIERKIQLFKDKVEKNPPRNWQSFFDKVLRQVNPFTREPAYVVLQLKRDPGLIRFIVTDEVIKEYAFKAEGYRLVVVDSKLKIIKDRLARAGYFSVEVEKI
jgi:hypothetical protein